MTTQELRMMMLDIDGILTRYAATATDVLAAAQQLAVSAIGDLTNKSAAPSIADVQSVAVPQRQSAALHRAADAIAEQIRAALHARISEGPKPDW